MGKKKKNVVRCQICGVQILRRNAKLLRQLRYCRKHLPDKLACPVITNMGTKCNNPMNAAHDTMCGFHIRLTKKRLQKRVVNINYYRGVLADAIKANKYNVRKETKNLQIDYHKYINSDEWKQKANAAKERAGNRCQLCNEDGSLHAHHRTYERIGDENPEDITVLCADCHFKFHNKGEYSNG